MKRSSGGLIFGFAVIVMACSAAPANAQGVMGRLKERAKQKVEQKAGERIDRAIDGAVDGAASGAAAAEKTEEAGQSNAPAAAAAPAASAKPGEGAWVNYDFVPGSRALYVDDFSRDNVGDFPRRLEFMEGNMEVAEWQGKRWLRATSSGKFAVPLAETLPERFTIEFDYAGLNKYELKMRFASPDWRDEEEIHIGAWGWGVTGSTVKAISKPKGENVEDRTVRVRVMADGKYVKVYVDNERVANVPNANLGRANKIWFEVPAWEETQALIGNLQVMAGGKKLYDALSAEGRVATQGIFFDTGSDKIRPESTPTLKEIGAMLQEHPELKLSIEGHTDNVGNADANRTLSEKRAAAVKEYLVSNHGVDASRLQSAGMGAAKPAASNDTPEGRQNNRRVELVKM